ncbi:MAG: NfeD family protein [Lachnospiraceae bacterium]|nr:NfeD family protein [Lachnospiraceae bacterium]
MEIFSQTAILFWLAAIVILLIMEIISLGLTTIWFAGGALVAFILAVFNVPVLIQVFVFLVVSLLLLIFTRPIAVKYFNKDRARTNVESMIGKQAIVLSEIDNIQGTGRVTVSGQEWSAKTMADDIKLPVGAVVIIKDVKGVKLIVEERKEEN